MMLSRKEFLFLATGSLAAATRLCIRAGTGLASVEASQLAVEQRVARTIQEYDAQGNHLTASRVDTESAKWLAARLSETGYKPRLEFFRVSRVEVRSAFLRSEERRIDGVPAFDTLFTGPGGVTGKLSMAGGKGDVGLVIIDLTPSAVASVDLTAIRRAGTHKALIVVRKTPRAGLVLGNSWSFLEPFGPPVLQVSSDELAWLGEAADRGRQVTVVADVTRAGTTAYNVVTQISGTDAKLPPVVVATPRSGWWTCAVERGSGIACWLETARALRAVSPRRDVTFVATSGHELGFLGMNAFLTSRRGLASRAKAWVHLGVGIGAAQTTGNLLQASDAELERLAETALMRAGTRVDRKRPFSEMPGGEVRPIRELGGRYISLQQNSAYFNSAADRWPVSVDVSSVTRYAIAFADITATLATS